MPHPAKPVHLSRFDIERIRQAQAYIATKLSTALHSQNLSQEVNISAYKLTAGFKQICGCTLYQYILHVRMVQAKELLTTTDLPIKAIAAQVGYSNTKHFLTAYKKFFGQTPGAVRAS